MDSTQSRRPKIANKWEVGSLLGKGSQGRVYKATDENGTSYAVKIENEDSQKSYIDHEILVYSVLHASKKRKTGLAEIHFGGEQDGRKVLVMQRLGMSLQTFANYQKGKICVQDGLRAGIQALNRLELVHSCGYVHRDVKPGNFVFGREDSKTLYLIDFGLAKPYIDPKTGEHIKFLQASRIVGTAEFISRHTHQGWEQSRRDDLEGLGYTLVFLMKGMLPWDKLGTKSTKHMLRMKHMIDLEWLCYRLPIQFQMYFEYVFKLGFEQEPDYDYLRGLFNVALEKVPYNQKSTFV